MKLNLFLCLTIFAQSCCIFSSKKNVLFANNDLIIEDDNGNAQINDFVTLPIIVKCDTSSIIFSGNRKAPQSIDHKLVLNCLYEQAFNGDLTSILTLQGYIDKISFKDLRLIKPINKLKFRGESMFNYFLQTADTDAIYHELALKLSLRELFIDFVIEMIKSIDDQNPRDFINKSYTKALDSDLDFRKSRIQNRSLANFNFLSNLLESVKLNNMIVLKDYGEI